MKTVVDPSKEIRLILTSAAVLVVGLVVGLTVFYAGRKVVTTVINRPSAPEQVSYELLPMDRTQVGALAVGLGFSASPDEIVGEGEESIYRWGKRGESDQFLEVSFKEGSIDYEAKNFWEEAFKKGIQPALPAKPSVSEIKVAERLAWDFLLKASLWDERITISPQTELFSRDSSGVESVVGSFKEANIFKVRFSGTLKETNATQGTNATEYKILAPDFETYLAKVEVYGLTGQVLKARIYPVYLGGELSSRRPSGSSGLDTGSIENTHRPEKGFLPEGTVVYIVRKGEDLRLWQAESAGPSQKFKRAE